MDVEFMCCECEPDAAISRCSPGQQKLSFAACDQDLDYESDCDSMSSCGSSAESHHSLSFTAPSYSPHSPHSGLEGMSEQATASSFVSLGLLQSSEGFQEGWLRELEAMGVPTTDDLEEALRSEGRLAYMPPKEKRPAPAPSSLAPPPSPFGQSSDQGMSSAQTDLPGVLRTASLRLPAPVFSQTLPAQIKSPLFGCECPICTGLATASPPAKAAAGPPAKSEAVPMQKSPLPRSWGIAAALANGSASPRDRLEPQTPPRLPAFSAAPQASQ